MSATDFLIAYISMIPITAILYGLEGSCRSEEMGLVILMSVLWPIGLTIVVTTYAHSLGVAIGRFFRW